MENDRKSAPRVVIIGAGFGGLAVANKLANQPVNVTILDRTNHHLFQPLLYQVATAGLSPANIAAPIRGVLGKIANQRVVLADVESIDLEKKRVVAHDLEFEYDFLVVATGARHSYFGHPEWEKFAPGLKTLDDALELRKRILTAFEVAEKAQDSEEQAAALTFVVIGGGPTGVEMAGAIRELARFALAKDFRRIRPESARVILLEGGPRLLPAFSPELSESAFRQLEQLGVQVRLNSQVSELANETVVLGSERIQARTIVWAAGNEASPLGRMLGAECDRNGRVMVTPTLEVPGADGVFVIGDLSHLPGKDGRPLPGVSPVAIQMGQFVARRILDKIREVKDEKPFAYWDKGSMATIGRNRAIAEVGPVKISGWMAWLSWLGVHLYFLIGYRNRLVVIFEWAWAYFTYQKGARLISGKMGDLRNLHGHSTSGN